MVAATELEIPHVSTRLDAYTLKITWAIPSTSSCIACTSTTKPSSRCAARSVSIIYGLLKREGDFYLFRRAFDSPETDAALRALGLHGAQKH